MENKYQENLQIKDLAQYIQQDIQLRQNYGPLNNGLQEALHFAREKILFWAIEMMENIGLPLRSIELFSFIFEVYWIKNQNQIPKSEIQKLAVCALYLVVKEIEKEEITADYLNQICQNSYTRESITGQIQELIKLFPCINIIVTPSVLLKTFKLQIDEDNFKRAYLFIYQTYENMICLNSAETLYISLRFIQTSPLMSCSEDEDNIKRIFINLVPQINCIQSLEQIIQDIHTFVEQNDDELSEDFMINNIGIPEDTRERKCSFDREDFSLTQQQADGGSQILNSLQQETEHDVSIEHDMNNNNNNNKEVHYQKEIIQNEINSLNQLHLNQNNGLEYKMFPEKNNYDEMEKPQSNNDCFCFQKGPYCDSGIFSSSFVNFNDLELKADNISNVSTATPVNSNYNSNNNNNNNNNNNINQYNLTNHFNTLNNHIQTNPSLITTSSSSQQIAQYNSSQSDHFNTNFSDTNFTKYLNENKAKLNIYDNFQSHSNFNSIQQLPTRITLDDDQQFD